MADTGIAAAKKLAAANTNGKAEGKPCSNCVKQGLAILPVITGMMPNSETRDEFSKRFTPSSLLNRQNFGASLTEASEGLDKLRGHLHVENGGSLKAHWMFMRALHAGYLYILKPDKTWDAYLVDSSGLLRRMPTSAMPGSPSEVDPLDKLGACARDEHSNIGLQFFVLDHEMPEVWLAYSRYRWTEKVLQLYASNGAKRDARMQHMDVAAVAAGQIGQGTAVPNGRNMVSNIGDYVADYSSAVTQAVINKSQCEYLYERNHKAADNACELAEKMASASKQTSKKVGAIFLLRDIVGKTKQINGYRNKKTVEVATLSGMCDVTLTRKRVVANIIEGIRLNAEENPGPFWDSNYGPERYLKHIDEQEWRSVMQIPERCKNLTQLIEDVSSDYIGHIESDHWKGLQYDFDGDDHTSALDYEMMVSICVAGSGSTECERKMWYEVLALNANDDNNWLARSLSGGHKPLIDYIFESPGDADEAYDSAKEAGKLVAYLATAKVIDKINTFRAVIRNTRKVNSATASIIETSTGILFNLRQDNPKSYRKLMRQVTLTLITRDDVIPKPILLKGTLNNIAASIMAVSPGDVRGNANAPIKIVAGRRSTPKGSLPSSGMSLSQEIEGNIIINLPKGKPAIGQTVAWVVTKLETGVQLNKDLLSKMKLDELTLNSNNLIGNENPIVRNYNNFTADSIELSLNIFGIFLQYMVWADALNTFNKKDKPTNSDYGDAGVGMLVSVLSASGILLEVTEKVLVKHFTRDAWTFWAIRLNMLSSLIEGGYGIYKGGKKALDGDVDSGFWGITSGAALAVSGIAGFGLTATALAGAAVEGTTIASVGALTATVAVNSTAIVGTGVTVGMYGVGFTLGPVGWALIVAALIGTSVYCAWQAFATDDENLLPIEYWLDRGTFGNKNLIRGERAEKNPYYKHFKHYGKLITPFATLDDEIYGLKKVTLVAQINFNESHNHGLVIFDYMVALPRYVKGSYLELIFSVTFKGKRSFLGKILCADGKTAVMVSGIPKDIPGAIKMQNEPVVKIDKDSGVMQLTGGLSIAGEKGDVQKFIEWISDSESEEASSIRADSIQVIGMYWPDRVNIPNLMTRIAYPPEEE